jgi:5-oxopent-3-ene-1,2,5-tricarboxylate decarboxylase/2-hydroxyhepta-2,4-diene-1,7-dioate isomerase
MAALQLPPPTKVIAVHLNYHSRAAERGRTPAEPSYFLKPASSVSAGGEIIRPHGAELLAYEGEVAVIIGSRARDVTPEQAWEHIGWYAPANDFGAQDFRWADRGSNLLAKGHDGYTPIGPAVPARDLDPATLRLRTTVNGEVRQDATGEDLIFSFGQLVADLARFMTLEPGDVILSGTPTGTGIVVPGDVVEVTLDGVGSVTSTVTGSETPLAAYGAMPKATDEARAYAGGQAVSGSPALSDAARAALAGVSTATLTSELQRCGISTTFLTGLQPLHPGQRMVGQARTLRYVAVREDVRDSARAAGDTQKKIIESLRPGEVLLMEARGMTNAGTVGDILAARALALGAVGIVTDGGVRDILGVSEVGIPTYYRAPNACSLWTAHVPMDIDIPITCAGVLVMPGDVIVGDGDGVVVLPLALAEEIAHAALEVETREAFAMERVRDGESIRGIYPLTSQRRDDYERWQAQRQEPTS